MTKDSPSIVTRGMEPRELARVMRALSDPNRLRICEFLRSGELIEKVIVAKVGISQPRVARHLAYLKRAQVVNLRRSGRYAIWSLNSAHPQVGLLLDILPRMITPVVSASANVVGPDMALAH